jgi:membrane-associated protein
VGIGAAIVPVAIGGVWKMMHKGARDEGVGRPNGNR